MEDKQIVELYSNREEAATYEVARKYGSYCEMVANNMLRDKEAAKVCVDECYQVLWDTIPPHRPQNLKAYLCKITRAHALNKNCDNENKQSILAELKECILDAATAEEPVFDELKVEITLCDFLKGLESEQRKIFLARYWWFASISEIASLYKMSENKVQKTLLALRQKFKVVLEQDEVLLYAMTELEDKYLEEMVLSEVGEEMAVAPKTKWRKGAISAIASVAILILIAIIVPKGAVEQPPVGMQTEDSGTGDSETGNSTTVLVPDNTQVDMSSLLVIIGEGYFTQADFEVWKKTLPWTDNDDEIATLPIYKNLAYRGPSAAPVYLDRETMLSIVMEVAEALKAEVSVIDDLSTDSNVYLLWAETNKGTIEVDGRGQVYIIFNETAQMLDSYIMPPGALNITNANDAVRHYLTRFSNLIKEDGFEPSSYVMYDMDSNFNMNYRAIKSGYGMDGLLDYYFNQIHFYFDGNNNLAALGYGDLRSTAELLGYYPIITLEKAKALLYEGDFLIFEEDSSSSKIAIPTKDDILFTELMYRTDSDEEYYQPYYCFYVQVGRYTEYRKCYVPAAKGAGLDGEIPEPEVEILDIREYDYLDDFVYHKGDKYYTVENGQIVETESPQMQSPYEIYGAVESELAEDGSWVTYFKYDGYTKKLNLTELLGSEENEELNALYIDGKVIVIRRREHGPSNTYVTCYWYDEEEHSLTKFADEIPAFLAGYRLFGFRYTYDRYAAFEGREGKIVILDLLQGDTVETGIASSRITSISNVGDEYYAVFYQNGQVGIVEKETGQKIKMSKYRFNVEPDRLMYKDGILYAAFMSDKLVYVISDFEE